MSKFPLTKSKREVKPKSKPEKEVVAESIEETKAMASSKVQEIIKTEVKEDFKAKKKPLIDQFKEILGQIELTPSNFKAADKYTIKQRSLENSITTTLKMTKKIQNKELAGIEIIDDAGPNQPTLIVKRDGDRLGISIWFFDSTGRMSNIKNKVFDYRYEYGNNLIFYIYDPSSHFKNEFHLKLKRDVVVVYKRSKDFD